MDSFSYETLVFDRKNCELINKNTFVHKFQPSVNLRNCQIGLTYMSIPFSWFNISSSLKNNNFKYKWIYDSTESDGLWRIDLPNAYLDISDLNNFLESILISRGHHLIDNNNSNVFYLNLTYNASYYSGMLSTTNLPLVLDVGWTNPNPLNDLIVGGGKSPQFVFEADTKFNLLLGFPTGIYPSTYAVQPNGGSISLSATASSNLAPDVNVISSVYINCNFINNRMQNNSQLFQFLADVNFGSYVVREPSYIVWNDMIPGNYNTFQFTFTNSKGDPVDMNDNDISLILLVRTEKKK